MKRDQTKMSRNSGQALVPILIIILTVITLGVATLYLSVGGMLLGSYSASGEAAALAAEGAMENGLLKLLRNPNYAGESLQVNGLDCTMTISGTAPQIILAQCASDLVVKKWQAEVFFINGEMVVDNYQEIE